MEEVVKKFEDFLISCVDVGTAPCWAIPALVEAKQWVEKASADPIRAVKHLCKAVAIVVKKITPFVMKKSHTIVRRPRRTLSLFEYRLHCQLQLLNSGIAALGLRSRAAKKCLFLTSEYVREGPENVRLRSDMYCVVRNEDLFIQYPTRKPAEEWVPYKHIDFPSNRSPSRSKNHACCCFRS